MALNHRPGPAARSSAADGCKTQALRRGPPSQSASCTKWVRGLGSDGALCRELPVDFSRTLWWPCAATQQRSGSNSSETRDEDIAWVKWHLYFRARAHNT